MVSHIHGIEYGEWEFKHTVAVRRLSFTGWIDVFARRMPEDDEASLCQRKLPRNHPVSCCNLDRHPGIEVLRGPVLQIWQLLPVIGV